MIVGCNMEHGRNPKSDLNFLHDLGLLEVRRDLGASFLYHMSKEA